MSSPAEPAIPVVEYLPAFEEDTVLPAPTPLGRVVLDERSRQGAEFSLLAARLRALGRDRRLRRVGVISAARGDGSTTVALGLARALAADRGRRVLLLELDLGLPGVDAALGLAPPELGLRRYLKGDGETPVLRRHPGGFWALTAGAGTPVGLSDAVDSPRFDSLLRAIDRVFDWVIADCPPLLPYGEPAVQELLDGLVFNVRARRSPRALVHRAAAMLKDVKLVGVVLNAER